MDHPDELLTRQSERVVINPDNPFVARPQLCCAAFEYPLIPDDTAFFGDHFDDNVRDLVRDDLLTLRTGSPPCAIWAGRGKPSREVGLRSSSTRLINIVDEQQQLIGTVDFTQRFDLVHPGAIYLHQGERYVVKSLSEEQYEAVVKKYAPNEYTMTNTTTDVTLLTVDDTVPDGMTHFFRATVQVTRRVQSYDRKDTVSGKRKETVVLDCPPSELTTDAFVFTFSPQAGAVLPVEELPGALHAAEHAIIGMLPLFAICDRWDVGGFSTVLHNDTGKASIIIYDAYQGGAGIAALAYESRHELLHATRDRISRCTCTDGCPSCIQSPKCGNNNQPLSKWGAVQLLDIALQEAPGPSGSLS